MTSPNIAKTRRFNFILGFSGRRWFVDSDYVNRAKSFFSPAFDLSGSCKSLFEEFEFAVLEFCFFLDDPILFNRELSFKIVKMFVMA